MKNLSIIILFVIILASCKKDDPIETTTIHISCARDFPVTVDGKRSGSCGTTLSFKIRKGAVLEIEPDIIANSPGGSPTGTTGGNAVIRYNDLEFVKYVTGSGISMVINW